MPLNESRILSNDSAALLWSGSGIDEPTGDMFSGDYSDLYSYYGEAPAGNPLVLAMPVADLNGDNASDILSLKIVVDPQTNGLSTEISAMSGSDGITLWQKEYPDGLAIPYFAEDLNGDGLGDAVIDVIIAGTNSIPYSATAALRGYDGSEIWSRQHLLAATFAYPVKSDAGANATDLVEHLFGIDSLNGSLVTKISRVDGRNGTEVESSIFPGALAVLYAAGNLTGDAVTDSITAVYEIGGDSGENITSKLIAKSGTDRQELWSISLDDSLGVALPVKDISGDGLDDLLVYMMSNNTSVDFELAGVQGIDGRMLWRKSSGESVAMAFIGPDMTGEGTKDLIVYKLNASGEIETEAVKGDDGSILWTKPMMILLPQ